jgi:hypothetical protein
MFNVLLANNCLHLISYEEYEDFIERVVAAALKDGIQASHRACNAEVTRGYERPKEHKDDLIKVKAVHALSEMSRLRIMKMLRRSEHEIIVILSKHVEVSSCLSKTPRKIGTFRFDREFHEN